MVGWLRVRLYFALRVPLAQCSISCWARRQRRPLLSAHEQQPRRCEVQPSLRSDSAGSCVCYMVHSQAHLRAGTRGDTRTHAPQALTCTRTHMCVPAPVRVHARPCARTCTRTRACARPRVRVHTPMRADRRAQRTAGGGGRCKVRWSAAGRARCGGSTARRRRRWAHRSVPQRATRTRSLLPWHIRREEWS